MRNISDVIDVNEQIWLTNVKYLKLSLNTSWGYRQVCEAPIQMRFDEAPRGLKELCKTH